LALSIRLGASLAAPASGAVGLASVVLGASAAVLEASEQAAAPNNRTPESKKVVSFFIVMFPVLKGLMMEMY
jgi:hypothetical protein